MSIQAAAVQSDPTTITPLRTATPATVRLPYQPFGAYRFLLALLVVVSHSAILGGVKIYALIGPWGLGNIAVMIFFVLSGYIIAEALDSFYVGRVGSFLANRALRILPPYFAALAASIAVHYWLQSTGKLAFVDEGVATAGMFSQRNLLSNIIVLGWLYQVVPVNLNPSYLFVRYVWAVMVEVNFYFAAAAIYAWRREPLLPVAFLAFAAWWILSFATGVGRVYYFTFAPHFLLGISLRYLHRGHRAAIMAVGLSLALALIHYAAYVGRNRQALVLAPSVCYAVIAMGLLVLARARISEQLRRVDRWLGDLSYPLYLNHYAVTIAVASLVPVKNVWAFLACLPLSIAASWIMAHLTEPLTRELRNQIRGVALR